jgi:hypothetical protein
MNRRIPALAFALVALWAVSGSAASPQKPLFVETVDSHESRLSLLERFKVSALVVRVVIDDAKVVPASDENSPVGTEYGCRVLEAFRGDVSVNNQVVVKRMGGLREEKNRLHRLAVRGFPDFEKGEDYILFLDAARSGDYFTVNPDGAYRLQEGVVRASGKSPSAAALDATSEESFMGALRKMRQ